MKAIGYKENCPVEQEDALQDIDLATPRASGRDILVAVKGISVNLVDYKNNPR